MEIKRSLSLSCVWVPLAQLWISLGFGSWNLCKYFRFSQLHKGLKHTQMLFTVWSHVSHSALQTPCLFTWRHDADTSCDWFWEGLVVAVRSRVWTQMSRKKHTIQFLFLRPEKIDKYEGCNISLRMIHSIPFLISAVTSGFIKISRSLVLCPNWWLSWLFDNKQQTIEILFVTKFEWTFFPQKQERISVSSGSDRLCLGWASCNPLKCNRHNLSYY